MGPETLDDYEKPSSLLSNGRTHSRTSVRRVQLKEAPGKHLSTNGTVAWHKSAEVSLGQVSRSSISRKGSVRSSSPVQVRNNLVVHLASRVGKYTLSRTLGRGNFAKVKLATHFTTGRQVAIKMIDKSTLNDTCLVKLSREVSVLKTLSHPNIIRLYEVIETARHVYLVTEYARNGELFDHLLKVGRLTETQARHFIRQLLSAVEYCHQKNIAHRDLKAENLLLDENNNLKLADFGFANTFDSSCSLDTFCGSPPYAAPELLSGQKYHGPEVDVWAIGVILYMLVCGQLPFEARNLKELHLRVTRGHYQIPFYVSKECGEMLKKMLVTDPTKRSELKELMNQTWINMGYEDDVLCPYVEPPLDYGDPIRRAIMNELGFNPDELKDVFENKRFNNVTATYLLLADTETRHKLTQQLRNRDRNDPYTGWHTGNTDVESSSDEDHIEPIKDSQHRSMSKMSHSGEVSEGQSRGIRANWITGSCRKVGLTRDGPNYTMGSFIRDREGARKHPVHEYNISNGHGSGSSRRSKLMVTIEKANPDESNAHRLNGAQRLRANASILSDMSEIKVKKPQVTEIFRYGHRSPPAVSTRRSLSTGRNDLIVTMNPIDRGSRNVRNGGSTRNGLLRLSVDSKMHNSEMRNNPTNSSVRRGDISESSLEENLQQKREEPNAKRCTYIHFTSKKHDSESSGVIREENQFENGESDSGMRTWRHTAQNPSNWEETAYASTSAVCSSKNANVSEASTCGKSANYLATKTRRLRRSPSTQTKNIFELDSDFSSGQSNGIGRTANTISHHTVRTISASPPSLNKRTYKQPSVTRSDRNSPSLEEAANFSIQKQTRINQDTTEGSRQAVKMALFNDTCSLNDGESSNRSVESVHRAPVFYGYGTTANEVATEPDADIASTTSKTNLHRLEKSTNETSNLNFSPRSTVAEQPRRPNSRLECAIRDTNVKETPSSIVNQSDAQKVTVTGSKNKSTSDQDDLSLQNFSQDTTSTPQFTPRRNNLALGIRIMGNNAHALMLSLIGALERKQISYTYLNPYLLQCTATIQNGGSNRITAPIRWETEVVQLPRHKTYGVRFKHIAGDNSHYRILEKTIVEQFPKAVD